MQPDYRKKLGQRVYVGDCLGVITGIRILVSGICYQVQYLADTTVKDVEIHEALLIDNPKQMIGFNGTVSEKTNGKEPEVTAC